jgi:hypothetical protein
LIFIGGIAMITADFVEILENGNVTGKRLTIYFNGKVVTYLDYPPTAEMSQSELDTYIANKLTGIFA